MSARFALALDQMKGVGRVTAGRLLGHFGTYEALRRFPREQVLARLKGTPRAQQLVALLFDDEAMQPYFEAADAALAALAERRIEVLTPPDDAWPTGLVDLPRAHRPALLYSYGHAAVLGAPLVALFAQPPLTPAAFEQAQALVRHLLPHGLVPATGAAHGFDVVVHKLCHSGAPARPSLLVAQAGMTRTPPPLRPTVSAVVKAGGLFLSSFAMNHGPFDHDDRERALILAALARACVFFEPETSTPAWHALEWAVEAGRPVFGVAAQEQPLPPAVHPLRSAIDFDWVLTAAKG